MPKQTRYAIVLFACLIGLSACDNSRRDIVGKWKASGGSNEVVWEFFSNGRMTTDGAPGRYTFGDGRRIKIQTGAATFVSRIEFQEDRMIWTDPGGSKMEFERVQ